MPRWGSFCLSLGVGGEELNPLCLTQANLYPTLGGFFYDNNVISKKKKKAISTEILCQEVYNILRMPLRGKCA